MNNQIENGADDGNVQRATPVTFGDRQLAIVRRLARSWARAEDEIDIFNEGLSPAAPEEAREVAQSYLDDTRDLLDGAHIAPLLAFADILSRSGRERLEGGEDVEIIQNHIGDLMADVALIGEQLSAFEQGAGPRREKTWEKAARRAIRGKTAEIAQAYRLLVRICPPIMGEARDTVAGDSAILLEEIEEMKRLHASSRQEAENLKAKAARKAASYRHTIELETLKSRVILDVVREKAPDLLGEIYAAVDMAQEKARAAA